MVLHHGNFAVGLNHKTNLLNYVNEMWQLNQEDKPTPTEETEQCLA